MAALGQQQDASVMSPLVVLALITLGPPTVYGLLLIVHARRRRRRAHFGLSVAELAARLEQERRERSETETVRRDKERPDPQ